MTFISTVCVVGWREADGVTSVSDSLPAAQWDQLPVANFYYFKMWCGHNLCQLNVFRFKVIFKISFCPFGWSIQLCVIWSCFFPRCTRQRSHLNNLERSTLTKRYSLIQINGFFAELHSSTLSAAGGISGTHLFIFRSRWWQRRLNSSSSSVKHCCCCMYLAFSTLSTTSFCAVSS